MDKISAGSFIKQQIEFDCPICSEPYDDEQRFPMMLCSSQHSCCLTCTNNIIFKKINAEAECPFCKAKIIKAQVKKFRLLHEIKETAGKLKKKDGNAGEEKAKSSQQLQNQLAKEREKNAWLIQQMKERDDMWVKKLKNDTKEEDHLKSELAMRRFEVQHLRAVIHDQNQRISLQRVKENSLLSENIKMKWLPGIKENMPNNHYPKHKFSFEDFFIVKRLGVGDYSTVYLAWQKRIGFLCALKVIDKWKVRQFQIEQTVIAQLKATSYLDHPNITKVYGYFWDQKNVYTISEYAVGESLGKYITKNPKAKYSGIIRQIALAVQELVFHSVVHNEINCNDVILTFKDVVKLTGFSWVSFVPRGSPNQEGYFKDIRAIAPICYQTIHPQKGIKDFKSSQIRIKIQQEIMKAQIDKTIANFIGLVLSKSDNPFHLLSSILNHPYLNEK